MAGQEKHWATSKGFQVRSYREILCILWSISCVWPSKCVWQFQPGIKQYSKHIFSSYCSNKHHTISPGNAITHYYTQGHFTCCSVVSSEITPERGTRYETITHSFWHKKQHEENVLALSTALPTGRFHGNVLRWVCASYFKTQSFAGRCLFNIVLM